MPRSLWTGAISFGLINIPVALYPAEERREFKFAMLDKRDFSPVGYKRYNKQNGKEVSWENVVKGYEYEKDQYVVLSDEDFRRANVKATQTIDIKAFVPAKEIPLEYFATPYFIAPAGKGGQKVYALLRETLRSTGRVAVAEVVIRTTQHLAAIVPVGRALMLDTMRWPDQLRDMSDLSLPAEGLKSLGITAKEAELAKRLVGDMAEHWKPADFEDTYHADLMRRIKEKISKGETQEISTPESGERRPSAQVIDLTALLKESLKGGERGGRKPPKRAGASDAATSATRARSATHGKPRAATRRKRA